MSSRVSGLDESGKFNMGDIYRRPDPRRYFSFLDRLNYQIPQNAKTYFQIILKKYRAQRDCKRVKLIDLGCSYGINAALLKFGLDLSDLYRRYAPRWMARLSSGAVKAQDRVLYRDLEPDPDLEVVGVDISDAAIGYASDIGLIDGGIATDLEAEGEPDGQVRESLSGADLVISTGCVGYVGEATFDHLMELNEESRPWFANFVLRLYPYDEIADSLAAHGYVTEKLEGELVRQRRFVDAKEQSEVLNHLKNLGIDTAGHEDTGWYFAELFVSRPEADVRALSLAEMMAECSGRAVRRPAR